MLVGYAAWKLVCIKLRYFPNIFTVLFHAETTVSNLKISDLLFLIKLLGYLLPKSSGFSFTVNPTFRKMEGGKKKPTLLPYRDLGGTEIFTYHAI